MAEVHDMFLEGPMENDVGEWICYTCGRRLLVRRTPNFEKVVLASGNEYANHVSIIGNKRVVNVAVTDKTRNTDSDTEWLAAYGISWED